MGKQIALIGKHGQGKHTIVDDIDFDWINQYVWRLTNTGYVLRYDSPSKTYVLMARQILNVLPGITIDHINRDPLDNRRTNLRVATYSENNWNMGPIANSSSSFKGVHFDKQTQRWRVEIRFNGRRFKLGRFDSELDAAYAYNEAATKHFGQFAYLNDLSHAPSTIPVRPKRVPASRFSGVFRKRKRWTASIQVERRRVSLGSFDTEEEAAQARDTYVKEHGLSLKLNFP